MPPYPVRIGHTFEIDADTSEVAAKKPSDRPGRQLGPTVCPAPPGRPSTPECRSNGYSAGLRGVRRRRPRRAHGHLFGSLPVGAVAVPPGAMSSRPERPRRRVVA
jgi:hypothetical protein